MASSIHKRGPTAPEMNITPLIDVTFLLIIFFMLVNNIVSDQFVEMFVPELDNPRTRPLDQVEGRVIVNIAPRDGTFQEREANPLLYSGEASYVQVGMDRFALDDLTAVTASLKEAVDRNPQVEVLLRADAALHFEEVQPVMVAIAAAGITQVNLAAVLGDDPVLNGATPPDNAANGGQ